MSEFRVEVVAIDRVETHHNADALDIVYVWDYPVVVKRGQFRPGDTGLYIAVEAVLPENEAWSFLSAQERSRLKAKRLRGVYSMGLLTKLFCTCGVKSIKDCSIDCLYFKSVGSDVRELLGIEKYEPGIHTICKMNTDDEMNPGFIPVYTDLESLRRYPNVLREGESVVLTEKIHGANARYCWKDWRLWAGSHHRIKKRDPENLWWKAAIDANLEEKLQAANGIVFYGEVYGQVQDLKYGLDKQIKLVFFDAFDISKGRYVDYDEFRSLCEKLDLDYAPPIYIGAWSNDLKSLAEGKTILGDGRHVREGFVVKPLKERIDHRGRVIFKMVGEGYHLRK